MSTLYADPRSYVESKPVSAISHKGLRVAARSATVYTCKVPDRHQVAKQNYLRRSHQMKKCGYSSVIYKPYETVGKVYLDNRNLIMVALGQRKVENSEDENSDDQVLPANKVLDAESDTKGADGQYLKHPTTEPQTQTSFKSHEKLENIQSQLVKGRKMVSAVSLGCSVFRFIKDEQKKKAAEAEMEQRRKLDDTKQSMKILSASSSDNSDDDESVAIKRVAQRIVANTEYDKCSDDAVNRLESTAYGLHSMNGSGEKRSENLLTVSKSSICSLNPSPTGKNSPRLKKKLRTSIRPYSAVYSNISYPEIDARESLFRQLCALNWILDAMSQDTFPPVVSPLTNCWNIRELYEEVRSSRRKVERQRQTESSWQTLLVNPGRFSQRDNRRGARRISVHPQHIQRLSAVTSSSSTVGLKTTSPERKPRHGSCSSTNPETYATEITTGESDWVPSEVQDETVKTTTGISTSAGKNQRNKLKTSKNISLNMNKYFSMTNNSTYSEKKTHTKPNNKSLSRRHLYRLTLSRRPESSSKKAESRVRAWVQQTGDPKIIHDSKQFNCSSGYQFMPGQGSPKTHFFTAALAAFGAIRVSNCTEKIPLEMRKRFSEITEEKKIMLNDKLEVQNKKRWNTLRRKLCSLDHSLHVREALEKMRKDVSFVETETREEMRQRVSEECKWYKNLINVFPDEIKYDPYISVILNKIARHGSLEGRKVSASHFLKVMGTLRTWELCYPEIAAAIEFVRENIVGFSSVEYDEWLSSQQPAKSYISAPGTQL